MTGGVTGLGSIPACFSAGEALQKALCTFTSPVLSWRHCVIEGQMTRVSKFVLLHFRFLSWEQYFFLGKPSGNSHVSFGCTTLLWKFAVPTICDGLVPCPPLCFHPSTSLWMVHRHCLAADSRKNLLGSSFPVIPSDFHGWSRPRTPAALLSLLVLLLLCCLNCSAAW